MLPHIEVAEQAPKMNGTDCSASISFSPFLSQGGRVGGICCENWWVLCYFLVNARLSKCAFYLARKVRRLEILLSSCRKSSFPVGILSSCILLCYLLRKKKTQHLPHVNSQPVGKVLQPQGSCSHLDIKKWVCGPPYKNTLLSEMEDPKRRLTKQNAFAFRQTAAASTIFPWDTSTCICLSAVVYFWRVLTCRSLMDSWGQFPFTHGRSIMRKLCCITVS